MVPRIISPGGTWCTFPLACPRKRRGWYSPAPSLRDDPAKVRHAMPPTLSAGLL